MLKPSQQKVLHNAKRVCNRCARVLGPANCRGRRHYAESEDGSECTIMALAPNFGVQTLEPWAKSVGFEVLNDGGSKGGGAFRMQMPDTYTYTPLIRGAYCVDVELVDARIGVGAQLDMHDDYEGLTL